MYSVSMDLYILDIAYKWNHTIYDCICFFHLAEYVHGFIYTAACINQYFIPFHVWVILHYIHAHTYTHIYHILFIHSSGDSHLGFACILAIVNNGFIEHSPHTFVWVSILNSFGYLGELLAQMVILCLRNHQTFPQKLHHYIYLPIMYKSFNFTYPHHFFYGSEKWYLTIFLIHNSIMMLSILLCTFLAICVPSLDKCLFQSAFHFLI